MTRRQPADARPLAVRALGPLLLLALPTHAATLHVCQDGSGEYTSLRAAVEAASSGDEIEVCDGVYKGPDNLDIDVASKSVTIRSVHGRDATTIDAEDRDGDWEPIPHRCFVVGPGGALRIEGITMAHAFTRDPPGITLGGTVRVVGGSLELSGCRIEGPVSVEWAASRGAGIAIDGGSLLAEDCQFLGNHAAVYGGAIYSVNGWAEVVGCRFRWNSACAGGGAVFLDAGSVMDCEFESGGGGNCECCTPGGMAIACEGPGVSVLRSHFRDLHDEGPSCIRGADLIEDCVFEDNDQNAAGCIQGSRVVRNCTFRRNKTWNYGPADICYATGLLEGCVFLDGYTTQNPGELRGTVRVSGDILVTRCTFARIERGAAIFIEDPATAVTIDRCVIAFGQSADQPIVCPDTPAGLDVRCTDIFGNAGGDWVGCVEGRGATGGNLSADPLFCNLPGGDLTVSSASPCSPAQSGECGMIGALGVACGSTATSASSWALIKALYR